MSSPAPVRHERTETAYTIYPRRLVAGIHLRFTLRRLHHRQLHRVSAK